MLRVKKSKTLIINLIGKEQFNHAFNYGTEICLYSEHTVTYPYSKCRGVRGSSKDMQPSGLHIFTTSDRDTMLPFCSKDVESF